MGRGALLAISSHERFAGIWAIDGFRDLAIVCFVPQSRFSDAGGLVPPKIDLDWESSGTGPANSNLCAAIGIRISPRLTWHI